MEITKAIKRPFQDVKTLLIGIALSVIPIVNLIALGYFFETAKATAKKDYRLLEWKGFGKLFVTGLLATIIGIIYALPIILIAIFGLGLPLLSFIFSQGTELPALGSIGASIILIIILAVIVAYVLPAAYLSFASSGKFGSGFDFSLIRKKAFNRHYFAAWFVGIIYTLVVTGVLMLLFFFFPFLGAAIGSFISGVMMYTLLGEAWAAAK
jgi:hypothetical protein